MNQVNNKSNNNKIVKLFFFKYEYAILNFAGIVCGLLIISIANKFFVGSNIYFIIFIFGFLIGLLGFLIEFFIKNEKRKTLEKELAYFLKDLSREYKKTKNLSLALNNISESNFYGSINNEIKRLSLRVSWGEEFEEALAVINENIKSTVISHTLKLLSALKSSKIPYYRLLENISKDINVFNIEKKGKLYFSNLFNLSIVFYFIFIFVILYIDFIIGRNFLWFSDAIDLTRIFFDNFLLYISLLLSFFTAFVLYTINNKKTIVLLKYVAIFFLITIFLFQIFIPKPDANEVIIDTINHLNLNKDYEDLSLDISISRIISTKTLSSVQIQENSSTKEVYFINFENSNCGSSCYESTIIIKEPTFFDFKISKINNNFYLVYYRKYYN
jgi:hypothetical protein